MKEQEFKDWIIQELLKYKQYSNECRKDLEGGHEEQQISFAHFAGSYCSLTDVIRNVKDIVHFTKEEWERIVGDEVKNH